MATAVEPQAKGAPAADPVLDEKKDTTADSTAQSNLLSQEKALGPATSEKAPQGESQEQAGPQKTPFPSALPVCKPIPPAALTKEQQEKYDSLLATATAWNELPITSAKGSPASPVTDAERMWLTEECLLRYLRATKWIVAQAVSRLQSTLVWRREYGLPFTPEHISPEQETGKQLIIGFDNNARPCHYLRPSKQNTKTSERQVQHLVFMLERVIQLMGPGQEALALVITYKESGPGGGPSFATGKKVLNILQNHYPERLGKALILDLPWFVTGFFKLITPFIDPITKQKLVFNEPLKNHVPAAQLLDTYGGNVAFEYDHSVYYPALNELCEQRMRDYTARWEARGKKIGDSEYALRGGEEKDVVPLVQKDEVPVQPTETPA